MGNHSILDARNHLIELILQSDSLTQAENIHTLCHAIEVLMQVDHMSMAVYGLKDDKIDFPPTLDLD